MLYEEKPWLKNYPPGSSSQTGYSHGYRRRAFDRSAERWANQDAIVFFMGKLLNTKN